MASKILSVKEFLHQLDQELNCSKQELQNIIRANAESISPEGREAFIQQIHSLKKDKEFILEDEDVGTTNSFDLLHEIDNFIEALKEKMESGAAEDYYNCGYDYVDDEDPLGPYEEDLPGFKSLFGLTEAAFDRKEYALVRKAYEKLFTVFEMEDDYSLGIRITEMDSHEFKEIRCRYLRSVYESELLDVRPEVLFKKIQFLHSFERGEIVLLKDVMEINRDELSEKEIFLDHWIDFLTLTGDKMADPFLREAIFLSQGVEDVARFAKAQWQKHPRAYLDWLELLNKKENYKEMISVALQALKDFPLTWAIRAHIADYLYCAAHQVRDEVLMRKARWEAFQAKPTLLRFMDLYEANRKEIETANSQNIYLQKWENFTHQWMVAKDRGNFDSCIPGDHLELSPYKNVSLLVHFYFLNQNWKEIECFMQDEEKVLGWSSTDNPQGIAVVTVFFLLTRGGEHGPNIKKLWNQMLGTQCASFFYTEDEFDTDEKKNQKRLASMYDALLSRLDFGDKTEIFLRSCLEISKLRIYAIVGNKHRGSYDKAAILTWACVELLKHFHREKEAERFFEEISQSFRIYTAFQRELGNAESNH